MRKGGKFISNFPDNPSPSPPKRSGYVIEGAAIGLEEEC